MGNLCVFAKREREHHCFRSWRENDPVSLMNNRIAQLCYGVVKCGKWQMPFGHAGSTSTTVDIQSGRRVSKKTTARLVCTGLSATSRRTRTMVSTMPMLFAYGGGDACLHIFNSDTCGRFHSTLRGHRRPNIRFFLPSQHYFAAWTIGHLVHPFTLQRPQGFGDFHQNSPKPRTSRVRMVARGMKDIFVEGPDVQRNRDRIEIKDSGVRIDEALGY